MGRAKAPLAILAVCITSLSAFLWWTLQPTPVSPLSAAEEPAPPARKVAAKPTEPTLGERIRGAVRQVTGTQPEPVGVGTVLQADALLQEDAATRAPKATEDPFPLPKGYDAHQTSLLNQTKEDAIAKSFGCVECHKTVHDPHYTQSFHLGCCDCHGGDPTATTKEQAHPSPRFPDAWRTSANPIRSYTLLNHERPEWIRFVNPGDLRVVHISCGGSGCHSDVNLQVKKSMMTHGCMLWGSALYNNGSVPFKWARYGESYSMLGTPQRLQTYPLPTQEELDKKGILPYLDPLPRYQNSQPGNVLRVFERGGRFIIETGIPERLNDPGKPREKLGARGLGTLNRTDPVFVSLNKTRLLDPTLNFMGTNDHAGDYRSSGCTACHVVYANDRSPVHSGPYAKYGNRGTRAKAPDEMVVSVDPTIPPDEPGHPIEHRFVRTIPSSQCMICHMHPGTTVMNSYFGYMWWDLETEGEHMWPKKQRYPTSEDFAQGQMNDPHEASVKGLWGDNEFLSKVAELNPFLDKTQFADFHGHGWAFHSVIKKDRDGTALDHKNNRIENVGNSQMQMSILIPQYVKQLYKDRDKKDPELIKQMEAQLDKMRDNVPVHMLDIHLEMGMHCIDCHYIQDMHGNTKLYGEVRAAIEIQCINCHGTSSEFAWEIADDGLRTTGPAAEERGPDKPLGRLISAMRTPFGERRFEWKDGKLHQNSMVEKGLSWEVKQTKHTIDPTHKDYNAQSAIAKTAHLDEESGEMKWGMLPEDPRKCAHARNKLSCIACHSSWNPSCYGCHLPQKADRKMPELHNEGDVDLNYTAYNWQTLRDEVYMLARDGVVTGNRIGPARSACAIHVGSYNKNRESIYFQQQTISGDGLSGIAFSSNAPHTVRGKGETKLCTDCHVSEMEDNNALLAQLTMQGTNFMNFIGKYCWVAADDHGLFAVQVTERGEPQAVIGSKLHKLAYPDYFEEHIKRDGYLELFHEHPGKDIGENIFHPFQKPRILSLQHRGEFLYAACGELGLRIFDIAFTDHKGFSERIVSAPVSPIGQRPYVRTKFAMDVAAPTTIAPDPTRVQHPENKEPAVHGLYANIYVADKYEGLVVVGVGTLLDGNPTNNFVERAVTFNPGGLLKGARSIEIVGTAAYMCCDAGLVIVDLEDPTHPTVACVVEGVHHPTSVGVQFRYGFVTTSEGLTILDTTDYKHPHVVSSLHLPEAHNVYVARGYAYVAGGKHGLLICDVTNPLEPKLDQSFTAGGCMNDVHDVKLGIAYTSQFAYVADGKNGLRVVQLTSTDTPGYRGFNPRPTPTLVATFPIPKEGHAVAISEGVDRDRAVDEAGNQLSVFGRVGARPLNKQEQMQMIQNRFTGELFRVIDGRRNYAIPDSVMREKDLWKQLVDYFPNYVPYDPRIKRPSVEAGIPRINAESPEDLPAKDAPGVIYRPTELAPPPE